MLGNPVPGRILANKAPWPGTPTFRVTSTFEQHVASGRGEGIDVGNGRCGDPILAMADGIVSFAGQLPTGIGMANVVRITHALLTGALGGTVESGYAHLATMIVARGQTVIKGQPIGTLGMTGADACHLHGGLKVNGVERDWWGYLDQNMLPDSSMGDDVNLKGTPVPPLTESSKRYETTVTWDAGMGVVADPSKGSPYTLLESPPGSPIHLSKGKSLTIDWQVTGAAWNGGSKWYGLWMWSTPPQFGYVPAVGCGPLVPIAGGVGHTDEELEKAEDTGFNEGRQAVIAKTAEVPPR